MYAEDEIGVPHSLLNFSYMWFVGKHVPNIVLPNIPNFDESDLNTGENVLDVPPMSGPIRSHLLKFIMQESKAWQEIVDTSTTIKGVVERSYTNIEYKGCQCIYF